MDGVPDYVRGNAATGKLNQDVSAAKAFVS